MYIYIHTHIYIYVCIKLNRHYLSLNLMHGSLIKLNIFHMTCQFVWKFLKQLEFTVKQRLSLHLLQITFVYPVHHGNLHQAFLPYSGQWWTPSNLMDLLGIRTVAPVDFFAWKAISKDDCLLRLLTPAFPIRSKELTILILKSFSKRQHFFSFLVEQSRQYRSHDWTTIISKKW